MLRVRRFEWEGPLLTASAIRRWATESVPDVVGDVKRIGEQVLEGRDAALMALTMRLDATEQPPAALRVDPAEIEVAAEETEPALREAMKVAATNIRAVAT